MKEKPILFSAPMVRAILSGRKTQTRRLVKPQPPAGCVYAVNGAASHALCHKEGDASWWVPPTPRSVDHRLPCPYGYPGARLWVKETWSAAIGWDNCKPNDIVHGAPLRYAADGATVHADAFDDDEAHKYGRGRPSIFMRRWMARITLEVTGVRVERLHDISEADAQAEGVEPIPDQSAGAALAGIFGAKHQPYASAYANLWETINGPGSWDANPWVWVIEFRRITSAPIAPRRSPIAPSP